MNFFSPVLQLITNNIFYNSFKKEYFVSFSGGQDSIFLFFLLLHLQKQQNIVQRLAYKNHNLQPSNFYLEFHIIKLSFLFGINTLISTYVFSKNSELEFKYYRYDLLFRQSLYYENKKKDKHILISHSQTDLIESKFLEFFQKNLFSFCIDQKQNLTINPILHEWPTGKNRKIDHYKKYIKKPIIFVKNTKQSLYLKKNLLKKANYFIIERPIWLIPRDTILQIIQNNQLPVQNDETNFCYTYLHNRCRHQIIPFFRFLFGKDFDQKIYQTLALDNKVYLKEEKLYKVNAQPKNIIKIKYFYNFRYLILNIHLLQYKNNDEIMKLFFFLNCLTKISFSIKEFLFILKNSKKDNICLLKLTFPQILLVNQFIIIRF